MIIDLIIIAIIALCTFIGYKQGLIKVAVKLLACIIALVIALTLYKPVTNYVIDNTQIDDNIQNSIVEKILPEGATQDDEVEVVTNIPDMIMEGAENTVRSISETITVKLIEIVALLGIFFIVRIVLKFVTILAELIAKIPILKQFNEVGGAIYGILQGFIWVLVILAIISLLSPFINPSYIEAINNSFIGSMLYNDNFLLNIIT